MSVLSVSMDVRGYLKDFVSCLENTEASLAEKNISVVKGIERVITCVETAKTSGASLIFIGNGGSAAIDGVMENRIAEAFAEAVKVMGRRQDVLFATSSSGNSQNILNAVRVAKEKGMAVVTLSGFDSLNPLRKMGEINFYVPSSSYRCVESAHLFIFNCILDFFLAVTNYRSAPTWS